MGRLLFLLLIVVAAVLWWKHSQRGRQKPPSEQPPAAPPAGPQAMLRCVECGVHLPAHQALPGKGGVFCSHEHRERFEARTP